MKTKLFLAGLFALTINQTILSQTDANGYTTVNLTTGPAYQNTVFMISTKIK